MDQQRTTGKNRFGHESSRISTNVMQNANRLEFVNIRED
jgi:hypothetical protein